MVEEPMNLIIFWNTKAIIVIYLAEMDAFSNVLIIFSKETLVQNILKS